MAVFQLRNIEDARTRFALESEPQFTSRIGGTVTAWPSPSYDATRQRASFGRTALRSLTNLDPEALSEDEYISWLVLREDMSSLGQSAFFYWTDLASIAPTRSPLQSSVEILARSTIASSADAERHLALVGSYATLVDSVRAGLEARASRGVTLSRVLLPRTVRFAHRLLVAADSSMPLVFPTANADMDSASRQAFGTRLRDSITMKVKPALERLTRYLESDYGSHTTERVGLWQFAGGKEHYSYLLRSYSTLDITPEEAHAIGLREIARLEQRVVDAATRSGLPVRADSLRQRLASDAQFRFGTAGDVVARVPEYYGHAASAMGKAFTRATELTADLQPMPADLEEDAPLGVYVPPTARDPRGHYFVNGRRWTERSALGLAAHTYADLLPGKHYQLALQLENDSLPAFRRLGWHAGFVDGWATYAISLADSLVPGDDVAHLGATLTELSFACGLVVDTGINYFGWTWGDALAFLRAHLPESDDELTHDILVPAIELPASLTAATLGARELHALRRWVEQQLGERFDLRAFHDEVLSEGAIPLPALGAHLEWWIWKQQQKPTSPTANRSR